EALLAFSEMPPSVETGRALYGVKNDKDIRADEWLSEAMAIAVARHNIGFLTAAADATKPASDVEEEPEVEEPKPVNLFLNPGFETVSGKLPKGWNVRTYSGRASHRVVKQGRDGGFCVEITSENGSDTSVFQDVPVEPNATYKLSGWIKSDAVRAGNGGDGICFNIHVMDRDRSRTHPIVGRKDWRYVERIIKNDGRRTASVNLLFGAWGWMKGKAWFDDISLTKVNGGAANAPEGMRLGGIAASNADPDELRALVASLDPVTQKKFRQLAGRLGIGKATEEGRNVDEVVRVSVIKDVLQFDRTEFSVTAGSEIKLIFTNPDHMLHNLIIGAPGSLEKIGLSALKMAAEPDAEEKHYVPDIP
ncbi:MAG: carbohydrate binding domain-containing protein, partial [Verrucomicrobiota bacterium]